MANKKLKWLESSKVDKVLSLCDWRVSVNDKYDLRKREEKK